MPEGITSMTRANPMQRHWEELGRNNRSNPRDERPYYILRLDGEIIYEGTRSGCRQRYKLTNQKMHTIVDKGGKFPDGSDFEEALQSERPMRKKVRIYRVYEGDQLITDGQHKDVVEDLGLGRGQLSPRTRTLFKKKYRIESAEEWIEA